MKRRRVKITGIGPVTPAGIGRAEFTKGILEPVSRVRAFTKLAPEFGPFVAAYLDKFQLKDYVPRERIPKGVARHTEFVMAGATLALADAGISPDALAAMNCAVVTGASLMDFEAIGRTIEGVANKGVRGALPRTIFTGTGASIPASVADVLGISARTACIQTSCCAGLDAIGHAVQLVAEGQCELAICGGTEAPLYRCPLVELRAAGLTPGSAEQPAKLDRPFDLWRTTGVVSEGAAIVILEPESSPRPGYGFIDGYGCASDSDREVCAGMADSMVKAIANAGCRPGDIDSISAWGPGHPQIDAAEYRMLQKVFGRQLTDIPTYSIKGAIGNPLGAAGALQVAAVVVSFAEGMLPPTVNWDYPDPACPLNLSARPRALRTRNALVNAHGMSGVNSAIVIRQ